MAIVATELGRERLCLSYERQARCVKSPRPQHALLCPEQMAVCVQWNSSTLRVGKQDGIVAVGEVADIEPTDGTARGTKHEAGVVGQEPAEIVAAGVAGYPRPRQRP